MNATPAVGNAKHQVAVSRTHERILVLRSEIRDQLDVLVTAVEQLDDLVDTRQRVGLGFITAEVKELANKQTRVDRAAARGMNAPRDVGLKFLNSTAIHGVGQSEAPVTMNAVSASAEVLFTLQQHVRRLAKPALLRALEAEQTDAEDMGICRWPRNLLTALPPTTDGDATSLAGHLARLVDAYNSRPGLTALLHDLEHAEATVRDVIDGPAKTNHPDQCPWCGRESLVIHHRQLGRDVQLIRCQSRHRCVCDDEFCPCQHNPNGNHHEWENSGRATHTWHDLRRAQTTRKETIRMETQALDALQIIAAMHQPFWIDGDGDTRSFYVIVAGDELEQYVPDHTCIDVGPDACQVYDDEPASSLHFVPGCVECQTAVYDGDAAGNRIWPCATYRATQLDT